MSDWMSISQVKERIAETSAEEVTASYLERIEKSKINGYVTVWDKAVERAKEVEGSEGPLAGVPIAIKDNISTKPARRAAG